ncbi:hypothetical protein Tco_0134566 [Tanacetum coccineum]
MDSQAHVCSTAVPFDKRHFGHPARASCEQNELEFGQIHVVFHSDNVGIGNDIAITGRIIWIVYSVSESEAILEGFRMSANLWLSLVHHNQVVVSFELLQLCETDMVKHDVEVESSGECVDVIDKLTEFLALPRIHTCVFKRWVFVSVVLITERSDFSARVLHLRSPSELKATSSIPGGIESFVRQASISSKMKSPPSKGVRERKEVERIGSKTEVGCFRYSVAPYPLSPRVPVPPPWEEVELESRGRDRLKVQLEVELDNSAQKSVVIGGRTLSVRMSTTTSNTRFLNSFYGSWSWGYLMCLNIAVMALVTALAISEESTLLAFT